MSKKTKNILFAILIVISAAILTVILWFDKNEQKRNQEKLILSQIQYEEKIKPTDENSFRLIDKPNNGVAAALNGTVIVDYKEFENKANRTSNLNMQGATVSFSLNDRLIKSEFDSYLLAFQMRATEKSAVVKLRTGDEFENLYVSTQWQEFCFPLKSIDDLLVKLSLKSDFQVLELSNFEIYGFSGNTDVSALPCGYYLMEKCEEVQLSETDYGIGRTSDILVDGEYMYTVGGNKLTISSVRDSMKPQVISSLPGIGNGRRVVRVNDETVAVAARQNGVYFIDVSDKKAPRIICRYNSLDTANDLCISGNLMVIVNRYFGIEFVDITDIRLPKYVNQINNNKECYRCVIDGEFLYVSCWATRDVEIYDISNVNKPQLISNVVVDGRCGEAFVENGLLYIGSGFNTEDNSSEAGDFGYGTGNGLTIYDVTDPSRPILLSVVKCDGSLFASGFDDWSVRIKNGYAYFTNAYDGIYIYDVSDAESPVRVKHVTVPLFNGTESYEDMTEQKEFVFPYDESKYLNAGNWAVELGSGVVYFGVGNSTIAVYPFEKAEPVSASSSEKKIWPLSRDSQNTNKYDVFLEGYDVTSVAANEKGELFVGTSDGILYLSSNMEVLSSYQTEEAVKDIKYNDGYLYTAEFDQVSIYEISSGEIDKLSEYDDFWDDCSVSAIEVTADNNYLIVQAYWSRAVTIDVHDKENPRFIQTIGSVTSEYSPGFSITPGSMYGRNLTNSMDNIVGIYGSSGICWLKSMGDSLEVQRMYSNTIYGELNGIAILSANQAIGVAKGGLVLFDFLNTSDSDLKDLTPVKVPDVSLTGKIAVTGDWAVLSNMVSGEISVLNIANLSEPRLAQYYRIKGNPQIASCTKESIYVPARNGGLICIKMN